MCWAGSGTVLKISQGSRKGFLWHPIWIHLDTFCV